MQTSRLIAFLGAKTSIISDAEAFQKLTARMPEPLTERTVVIGNSGSGKSTLAEAMANLAHIPVIDLDLLHWEGDGYGSKRNEHVARRMVLEVSSQPRWIIEGAFGWLAEVAIPKATALIWLDFPWSLLPRRAPSSGSTARSNKSGCRRTDGMGGGLLGLRHINLVRWSF